jgi:hypothetical protein
MAVDEEGAAGDSPETGKGTGLVRCPVSGV